MVVCSRNMASLSILSGNFQTSHIPRTDHHNHYFTIDCLFFSDFSNPSQLNVFEWDEDLLFNELLIVPIIGLLIGFCALTFFIASIGFFLFRYYQHDVPILRLGFVNKVSFDIRSKIIEKMLKTVSCEFTTYPHYTARVNVFLLTTKLSQTSE